MFKRLIVLFVCITLAIPVLSQKTSKYEDLKYEYNAALDLFKKQKYGPAQKHFQKVIEVSGITKSDMRMESEYYRAICAIELFNKDAEYLIGNFIEQYPESQRVMTAYFQMGKYQFRKKKYRKATEWFGQVELSQLTREEQAEYYFKMGYSYFILEDYTKANKMFYEIKDIDTRYTVPAIYYYSHIEYLNENYQTALEGFERLSDNPMFSPIIPYYKTQIFYYQKKFDQILSYAPPLLDSASTKRAPEIARVIAEAYYRTFKYKEAIPYLERYMDEATIITREDYYKLAYCYYRNEKYKKAAKKFSSIANSSDRLAQNAYYHLGDCYLQMGEKNKARYAFLTASELKFDKQMSEDALFTYAKLTYELSMYPFNEAVNALNLYIEKYPESNRVDEAYKFLVNVFMTTRNYKDALESIESIRNLTGDIALIYQRVAYFRGLELFNDLQYKEAIDHFDKSLDNAKLNPVIKAQSLYWRAEAYYKLGKYKKAIEGYEAFVLSDGSFELPEYNLAHYNLGYANFKIKQYDKAITWFRMYDQFMENKSSERLGDAYNRIGDCYFISKKYDDAVIYYDESIESELKDVDYALYQKGFALGLLKDYNQKIIVLNQLLNDYSKSSYRAAALFELAKAYLIIEAPEMAISTYQTIIDEYPYSSYVKKAYLGQGLIYYNSGDNDLALEKYKRVVEEFPGNPEIDDALIEIKKIYLDMNNVEGYVDYSNSIGEYTVTKTEEDSLMFITAEKIYLKGDCDQAKGHLNKYIKKFPNGRYILSAHYYKANCNMQNGDEDEALESYQFIISKPKTKYTSNALYNAAKINYKNKNYKAASENYTELEQIADRKNVIKEARIGKMRCNYFIKDYEKAITSAIAVLKTDKIADEIYREAHYDIAKSYYAMDNLQNAMDEFMIISQDCKSREGAEAKFRVAEIYFKQGADTLAENEIIDFNKKMTPYQDWVARSIILLSDIYVSRDDNFQAKAMLQSIITNYSTRGDGIIELAEDKLEDIVTAEEAESMLEESIEDFEVVFEHSDLFDDAEVEKEESNNPDKQSVIESSQEKAVDSKEEEVQPEDKVEKNADEPKEQENTPEIEKGNNNGETE